MRDLKPDNDAQRAGVLPRNEPTYRYLPMSEAALFDAVFAAAKEAKSIARGPSVEWLRSFTEKLAVRVQLSEERPSLPPDVTRFEVIDHRGGAQPFGRVFSAWDCHIDLSYQDAGRTLKVFVNGDATPLERPPLMPETERAERYAKMRADRLARGADSVAAPEEKKP